MRVSCSLVIAATRATGIAVANSISNASNSNVNPDSGRAQTTSTRCTPCSGQRVRGTRGVQERLVLEEIHVPPRLGLGVVHRAGTLIAARHRTRETRAPREVQVQIQSALNDVEIRAGHPPRLAQPQSRLEQIQGFRHSTNPPNTRLRNVTTLAGRHPEPQAGTRPHPPDPARSPEKATTSR